MTPNEQSPAAANPHYPGLNYSAWPSDWLTLARDLCGPDDGNISSVPEYLRPYAGDNCTPEGWLKVPSTGIGTPFQFVRFTMAFDLKAPLPWRGTGCTPRELIAAYERRQEEVEAEKTRHLAGFADLYFIGSDDGPIKIGLSSNPVKRLKTLQTGYPQRLRLLAVIEGGGMSEPEYHRRFAAHRLEGEWFERCPEIIAEIERLGGDPSRLSNLQGTSYV